MIPVWVIALLAALGAVCLALPLHIGMTGICLLLLAAVLLALRILKKKNAPKHWSRLLTGLTAAGMAVIFGAMGYIAMQGQDSVMTQDETPEFVVVLGAQVQGDQPSLTLKKRLDKALELGADGVINGKEQNAVQAVLDLTDGFGCDLVIETAGTEFTTRQAIEMVHKGATIVLVGYSKSGEMTLPVSLALDKELTFKTVFRYRHIYPMAIDAVASGKINLKGVVTNIFDFDDIQNAMDKSIADKANIVKAVVKIADETRL